MSATAAEAPQVTAATEEDDPWKGIENPENLDGGVLINNRLYSGVVDFTIGEAEMVKAMTEMTPQEVLITLNEDQTDPSCLRAIAWVILHRENDKVEWDDKRITESSVGLFFKVPPEDPDARPPDGRPRRS